MPAAKRFTTYEKIETIPLIVIKKDNNREPYDRSKIEGGILRACHKRPVSVNQIKKAVDEIETEIFSKEEKEISSREIGEMVMRQDEGPRRGRLCAFRLCLP
jgi:transcriptional repressor NrdR